MDALWNLRVFDQPTQEDALVVARALRREGGRESRRLAEQIEQACGAAPLRTMLQEATMKAK